jgi:hypothetical protein
VRGKLTVEKASSNMSVFFKGLDIVAKAPNGSISRKDFGRIMGDFIGIPSVKDEKENRTPFNKSKFPRYFGFLDLTSPNDNPHLKITKRGERLHSCISDYGEDFEFEQRYYIKNECFNIVSELFWESILFDSFGRNNSGAEESCTDIDPVKVIIKSLFTLEFCTREELCFIIFGLNESDNNNYNYKFNSIEEAVLAIKENRYKNNNNYDKYFERWGKVNIVRDFKILNILSDHNVRVLKNCDDKYSIVKTFAASYLGQVDSNYFSPYYYVKNEKIFLGENDKDNWIREIRLGGVLDENIIVYDGQNPINPITNKENRMGQFETALIKSYEEPKVNIYLWFRNINENFLQDNLNDAINLFERVEDFQDSKNGFSVNYLLPTNSLAIFLSSKSKKAKKKIREDQGLYFQPNLHIIIQKNNHE